MTAAEVLEFCFRGIQEKAAETASPRFRQHIDGDDPAHSLLRAAGPKVVRDNKTLDHRLIVVLVVTFAALRLADQLDAGRLAQEVAHLLLRISDAFGEAGSINFHQARKILRTVVAQSRHQSIVLMGNEGVVARPHALLTGSSHWIKPPRSP